MPDVDVANGFANRFTFWGSRRSKRLPSGGNLDEQLVAEIGTKVRARLVEARKVGIMHRTPDAEAHWSELGDAGNLVAAARAFDGKALVAVTDDAVLVAQDKDAVMRYSFRELHSVSVLGDSDPVLFAPLRRGVAFESVSLRAADAVRLADVIRARLAQIHDPGDGWWNRPTADLVQ